MSNTNNRREPVRIGGQAIGGQSSENGESGVASRHRRPMARGSRQQSHPYRSAQENKHEEETFGDVHTTIVERVNKTIRGNKLTLLCNHCTIYGDDNFIQGHGNRICGRRNDVQGHDNLVLTPEELEAGPPPAPPHQHHYQVHGVSDLMTSLLMDVLMRGEQRHVEDIFQLPGRTEQVFQPDTDIKGYSQIIEQLAKPPSLADTNAVVSNSSSSSSSQLLSVTTTTTKREEKGQAKTEEKGVEKKGQEEKVDEEKKKEGICVICQTESAHILLLPCAHLCVCSNCLPPTLKNGNTCPVCREKIKEVKRVYLS